MKTRAIAAAVAAVLSLSGAGQAAPPEVPYGDDFQMYGFSVGSGGDILIYAGVREIGGKTGVCGVIWFEGATSTTKTIERQFTEKMSFSIAGQPIRVSTSDFMRYNSREEVEKAGIARCFKSNRAWDPAYAKTPLVMSLGSGAQAFQ
jgi:hypothetical protein